MCRDGRRCRVQIDLALGVGRELVHGSMAVAFLRLGGIAGLDELELELILSQMAQKPMLRG